MKTSRLLSSINRRVLISSMALSALTAFCQTQIAMAQQAPPTAGSAFSFAVYGDSRPMMYLPSKEGNPDLTPHLRRVSRNSINYSSKCSGWSCRIE